MLDNILAEEDIVKDAARDGHGSRTLLDPPLFKGLGLIFRDLSDPGRIWIRKIFDGSESGSQGADPDPDLTSRPRP